MTSLRADTGTKRAPSTIRGFAQRRGYRVIVRRRGFYAGMPTIIDPSTSIRVCEEDWGWPDIEAWLYDEHEEEARAGLE